ncbi:DUF3592 domain-containing protein [Undibacterium sp. TJN19]|uniref:DUF3592 domain-containing protein n=1 Tax=Undibacterium sp. TJN19 TaxID=3413055 RepID=UPI003BF5A4B5
MVRSVVAVVCALGFAYGSWQVALRPAAEMFRGWSRAQGLVAVPAKVDRLELRVHEGEAITRQVLAEFTYAYQGRQYHGQRINIGGDSSDNIDTYQQDRYHELQEARATGRSITVWLDPQEPGFAVYDRAFRLTRLLFILPFALILPAISLGSCWALWVIWRPVRPGWAGGDSTGIAVPPGGLVLPAAKSGAITLGLFTLFWNIVCWPIVMVAFYNTRDMGNLLIYLTLIFPAIGVLLVYITARAGFLRWRAGDTVLSMMRQPVTGAENRAARLHFRHALGERMREPAMQYPVSMEIKCVHEDSRGEDTVSKTLWSQELPQKMVLHGAQSMDFRFDCPAHLPAAGVLEKKYLKIGWTLEVRFLGDAQHFSLPVEKNSAKWGAYDHTE